jgi:hypothetical protein
MPRKRHHPEEIVSKLRQGWMSVKVVMALSPNSLNPPRLGRVKV